MGRLRVALDVRPIQLRDGSGQRGIGRYVRDLATSVHLHGDVELVLITRAGPLPEELSGFARVDADSPAFTDAKRPLYLRLPKLRSSNALYSRYFDGMRREANAAFARAVAEAKADLVHLPGGVDWGGSPTPPMELPVVRSFLDAIPAVHPEIYLDTWPPFLREYYAAELARFRLAARVPAISGVAAEEAVTYAGVARDRLRVVYPVVGEAFREPTGPTPLGLTKGEYILFCSTPDAQKMPETAIAAFARAELPRETKLVFACPERHPERRALEASAARQGLQGRFLWTGFLSDEEVPPLFRDALALISPSLAEGFGLPAAQALAAGTPVVASDRSALAEVVGEAGILANPTDPDAFARGLSRVAADAALREELRERGRARAETFRSETQGRALAKLYGEAVNEAPEAVTERS